MWLVEIAKQPGVCASGASECVDNRQSLISAIVGETDSSANGHPVFLAELTSNRWGPGDQGGGGTITNFGRV